MVVIELLWDDANEAHIAVHGVACHEVVEVVFDTDAIFAVDDTTAGAGCSPSVSPEPGAISCCGSTNRP